MQRVDSVIDTWYDSGAMPFAQFHYPFENEEEFERALPRRLHLRGPGPDPRLVLLAARRVDPAVRPSELPQLRLPRPDPRPRGPEDVEEPRQRRRPLGGDRRPRRRRLPLVLPDRPGALGRLPLLGRHGRRIGPPVPAHALEHLLVLGPLRERRGPRPSPTSRARSDPARARRPRPLGALAPAGDGRRPSPSGSRVRLHPGRARDRRLRRGALELVRPSFPPPLLGGRRGGVREPCGDACSTVTELLAPFTPFLAEEIYRNLAGGAGRRVRRAARFGPPARLPVRRPGAARPGAGGGDGGGAADGRARPRRPRPGEGEGAPAAAPRGDRRQRGRAGGDRGARRPGHSPSSTSRSSTSSPTRAPSSPTRRSRTTARSGRASARRCRRSRPRWRRSTRPTSPR